MKKKLGILGGVILAILIVLAVMKERADARYFDDYDPALPFNATSAEFEQRDQYTYEKVYFDTRPGERIPVLLTFPNERGGDPLPLVIFLHGIGQKKDFLHDITIPFNQNGFAMACFDQHMQGERKLPPESSGWEQATAFVDRPWKTVNDARRLIDYVHTRDEIDPERIYVVGASYGAITGSTFVAKDPRVKAVALVYGAADINEMLQARMINDELGNSMPALKPVVPLLRHTVAYILDPADPIHYVGQIAPRPVLFQNGRDDGLIATPAAEVFHAAAGEPKEITWYEGDHIGLNEGTVIEVLAEGLAWLLKQDAPHRDEPLKTTEELKASFQPLLEAMES